MSAYVDLEISLQMENYNTTVTISRIFGIHFGFTVIL